MKLYLLTLFVLLGFLTFSQDFNGGLIGGLSTSEISGDRLSGPNKAGLYLGAYVNRYFSDRSSVQMELDFIQKGSRRNPDSTNFDTTYLLRLNYIEIPVHYKYDFAKRGSLETGLSLGVLVNSYEEEFGMEAQGRRDFKNIDLSFNIGAYYKLTDKLWVNIRYSNSILAVRPHPSLQTYRWNKGQYNEVLSFTLHYQF